MAFYAPSVTDAWASVAYIQDQLYLGWLVRGLHSAGASLVVLGMVVHMIQVALFGAYRAPREVNWWTGLLLALLIFGFALTGYLLPWDQKGYWATQVATTLLGAMPLFGQSLQTLVQGGSRYGNLTLTHFYSLHVFWLPGLLLLVAALHLSLFRRHGVTPRWDRSPAALADSEPFWPRQAVYDLTAGSAYFVVIIAWVVRSHGAELSSPADPTARFDARPEWYFLPLYQLLKYFPGPWEVVAALGAPLLFIGALALLPVLDRAPTTAPSRRWAPLLVLFSCLLAATLLGLQSQRQDRHNPAFVSHEQESQALAQRARALALEGVPAAGGTAVFLNDPLEQGRLLFVEHCTQCHRLDRLGPVESEQKGPNQTGLWSRRWIEDFLRAPDSPRFYGRTKLASGMKAVDLPAPQLADLVEYVYSLSGARDVTADRVARGAGQFEEQNCDLCHERDGKTSGQGPSLYGYGSAQWLKGLLEQPGSAMYFGEKNDMPSFAKKLTPVEIDRLTSFLLAQRSGQKR
jgi:ubiquinol-cytochrome c reductase cytochrome b subunit